MAVNSVIWADPIPITRVHVSGGEYPPPKIAAVSMETDQIVHIFKDVLEAAKGILKLYYPDIDCSDDTIWYAAEQIGKACKQYHKEVLSFWWKRI